MGKQTPEATWMKLDTSKAFCSRRKSFVVAPDRQERGKINARDIIHISYQAMAEGKGCFSEGARAVFYFFVLPFQGVPASCSLHGVKKDRPEEAKNPKEGEGSLPGRVAVGNWRQTMVRVHLLLGELTVEQGFLIDPSFGKLFLYVTLVAHCCVPHPRHHQHTHGRVGVFRASCRRF